MRKKLCKIFLTCIDFSLNIRSTAEEKSRILSFEILIQQKARSILMESKFREFLKYSSVFSIAVSGFLKQERSVG
jgi:hypothetical protein